LLSGAGRCNGGQGNSGKENSQVGALKERQDGSSEGQTLHLASKPDDHPGETQGSIRRRAQVPRLIPGRLMLLLDADPMGEWTENASRDRKERKNEVRATLPISHRRGDRFCDDQASVHGYPKAPDQFRSL